MLLLPPKEESFSRDIRVGVGRYLQGRENWHVQVLGPIQMQRERLTSALDWVGDGVIMQIVADDEADRWRQLGVPVVSTTAYDRVPTVRNDNEAIGRVAAEHLLQCGLKHFGYVGHRPLIFPAQRGAAFVRTVEAAGFTCSTFDDPPQARQAQWERAFDELADWLRALPKPVGVMANNDYCARQTLIAAGLAGLDVPRDVAIIGADNDEATCALSRPTLSSVILDGQRVGYEAAAMLDRLMDGETLPDEPVLIPPRGIAARRSTDMLAVDDEQVAQAMQFMRDQRHRPVTVEDILAQLPMSRATLERRFRKAMGCSPWQELRRLQLEHVREQLRNTELDIKQIAARSAFPDPARLGVIFREAEGCSPTAYRRRYRTAE